MPVQPFVPPVYRADRVFMIANGANEIHRFDETILTQEGSTITAYWQSWRLNLEHGFEYTLEEIQVLYSADSATTITLTASGDGGNTWTAILGDVAVTTIDATTGDIRTAVAGFNVTGYDLRLRIQFTTDVAVKIFGFIPKLVKRGRLRANDYSSP